MSHMRLAKTKMAVSIELCIVVVLSELCVCVAVVVVRSVIGVDLFPEFLHFLAYALSVDDAFREVLV